MGKTLATSSLCIVAVPPSGLIFARHATAHIIGWGSEGHDALAQEWGKGAKTDPLPRSPPSGIDAYSFYATQTHTHSLFRSAPQGFENGNVKLRWLNLGYTFPHSTTTITNLNE